MPRHAITLGCFILNAIWVAIFLAASLFRMGIMEVLAALAAFFSFVVAMGHLLYPYRGVVGAMLNWWGRNISLSQQPKSLQKFHKRT